MKFSQSLFSLLAVLIIFTVVANEEIDSKNDLNIEKELLENDTLVVLNDGEKTIGEPNSLWSFLDSLLGSLMHPLEKSTIF